jgi:hypothetical protein
MTSQAQRQTAVEWNPAYPPPPPTAPPKKGPDFQSLVVGFILIGLLFGTVMGLAMWFGHDKIGRAQIGDCLRFRDEPEHPYRVIDCADPSAGFTLLATKPTAGECIDVPGVSRIVSDDLRSYCIGEKGVDVSKAINGIKAGECVIVDGEQPSKAACRKGSIPVLLVLNDVKKTADPDALGSLCVEGGAEDVRQTYAWGISALGSKTIGTWDRLLCLGPPKK